MPRRSSCGKPWNEHVRCENGGQAREADDGQEMTEPRFNRSGIATGPDPVCSTQEKEQRANQHDHCPDDHRCRFADTSRSRRWEDLLAPGDNRDPDETNGQEAESDDAAGRRAPTEFAQTSQDNSHRSRPDSSHYGAEAGHGCQPDDRQEDHTLLQVPI